MLSFKLSSYYHGNCVLRLFFHPLKNGQRDVCLFKLIRFSLLSFYLYFLKVTVEDQTMPLVIKLTCSGLSRLPDPVGLEALRDLSHRESQMWGRPPHFPFSFPSQVPSFHLWSRWLLLPGPAEMPSWGSGSFQGDSSHHRISEQSGAWCPASGWSSVLSLGVAPGTAKRVDTS